MEETKLSSMGGTSRRDFIKKTALASAGLSAGLFASGNFAYAGGKDTLRVGLIGCGGTCRVSYGRPDPFGNLPAA